MSQFGWWASGDAAQPTNPLHLPAAQSNTRRGKNGIMSDMKGHAKSALALTLAIAGGLASPLRSDATNYGFISAPSHMLGISHFKLMAS